METLMVVGCHPLPGREDELNRWYSWVHIRDVMRLPGSLSAQRYALGPVQPATNPRGKPFSYLTIYEVGDKAECNKGHVDLVFTDRMPISTAFDFNAFHEAYFDPLEGRGLRLPKHTEEQPVMLIALDAPDGADDTWERFLTAEGVARIAALPGISAASAFRFGTDQMMDLPPRHSHLIVAHIADLSLAVAVWDRLAAKLGDEWGVARETLRGEVYLPLMRRLHARDVLEESAEAAAIAADSRAALGEDIHRPGANQHL